MFTVLVDLARYEPDAEADVVERLGRLDEAEWGQLLQLAAVHRVMPNLVRLAARQSRVPPGVATMAAQLDRLIRTDARCRTTAHRRILRALAAAGVEATVLKGALLARVLYPEPHLRSYNDLDVLVEPGSLAAAAAVLRSCGLEQAEFCTQDSTLRPLSEERIAGYAAELQHEAEYTRIDPDTGLLVQVDLHFRLSTVFDHLAPDTTALEFADYPVADLDRPLRGLAPADAVCHLCYHAWWDTQSVDNVISLRDLRLYQLADARLAMRRWQLDCGAVLARAEALGVAETTHWGLKMVAEVFGDVAGTDRIDDAAADDMGRRLSDRWVQRGTDEPFSYWPDPAWERIRRPERALEAPLMFARDYVGEHARRGDVLLWQERTPDR